MSQRSPTERSVPHTPRGRDRGEGPPPAAAVAVGDLRSDGSPSIVAVGTPDAEGLPPDRGNTSPPSATPRNMFSSLASTPRTGDGASFAPLPSSCKVMRRSSYVPSSTSSSGGRVSRLQFERQRAMRVPASSSASRSRSRSASRSPTAPPLRRQWTECADPDEEEGGSQQEPLLPLASAAPRHALDLGSPAANAIEGGGSSRLQLLPAQGAPQGAAEATPEEFRKQRAIAREKLCALLARSWPLARLRSPLPRT